MFTRASLCLASLLCAALAVADEPADEPKLEISISIDGKTVDAVFDEPVTATIDGQPHVVKLTAKPTRLFSKANVEFRYPSYFTYEFDNETPRVTIYTVEGRESTLMLQIFDQAGLTSTEAMNSVASELRSAFGDSFAGVNEIETRLGGKNVRGRRITANFAGQQLHQDVFPLAGVTGIFMHQRVANADSEVAAEVKSVEQLLNETFRVKTSAAKRKAAPKKQ
ncbi:MAG: hypothetical protein M3552_12760 [Planctomycetota bacterium]|nr:hypothetical protein [Planctomycetaceae bacterium]MDQ3331504.1 hypothetical protein [Planctomycetota bacterium]